MIQISKHESCVFCPKLCRHACPVAIVSGREAGTPTAMMTAPWAYKKQLLSKEEAARFTELCAGCGACTKACKLEIPVKDLLATAKAELSPSPEPIQLPEIMGHGDLLAIAPDERNWAQALEKRTEKSVCIAFDKAQLGYALLGFQNAFQEHKAKLHAWADKLTLVVADGKSFEVAQQAKLQVHMLTEFLPNYKASIECGQFTKGKSHRVSCCGANLRHKKSSLAADLGNAFAAQFDTLVLSDAVCAQHLRSLGLQVKDPIDQLME